VDLLIVKPLILINNCPLLAVLEKISENFCKTFDTVSEMLKMRLSLG